MVCPRCSAINRVDARFCRACGATLSRKAPAALEQMAAEPAALAVSSAAPDPIVVARPGEPEATAEPAPHPQAAPPMAAAGAASAPAEERMASEPGAESAVFGPVDAEEPLVAGALPGEPQAAAETETAPLLAPTQPDAAAAGEIAPMSVAAALPEGEPQVLPEAAAPGQAEAREPAGKALGQPQAAAPEAGALEGLAAAPLESAVAGEAAAAPPENAVAGEAAAAPPESTVPGPAEAAGSEASAPEGAAAAAPESTVPAEAETAPLSAELPADLPGIEGAGVPLEPVLPPLGVPDADVGPFAGFVGGEEPALTAAPAMPPDAPTAPLPAFGVPAAAPAEPPPFAPDTAGVVPSAGPSAAAAESAPEDGGPPDERATSHLDGDEAPAPAPPVPGEAFPALQPGAVVAGRYRITEVLQTGPQRQSYLAQDQQGYLRCWSCGSRDNVQGELYCTNCGAQLTGRTYRLLETPPDAPLGDLPAPLVENQVPGLALVFDTPSDSQTGRHYLVLEDVGGQPLSAWTAAEAESPGPVPDERLLSVLSQAADRLQELHAAGIVGCDFTPQALHVLADDRLVLADPSACRLGGSAGAGSDPGAAAQADVQRVAAALEQWYAELRPGEEPPPAGETGTPAGVLARGREGAYRTAAQFAAAVKDLLALTVAPRDLQLVSGRASDVGVQRSLNEDSLFALECVAMEAAGSTPIGIYIVADGMGGHESGEVASSIAIRTIAGKLTAVVDGRLSGEQQEVDPEARRQLVRSAILDANGRITRLSQERGSDMGTTVTMAVVIGNQATVANVGDSRTYLWRDGKLHQITQDHSLVARLVAAGQITPEEGLHFDRRNEIYRALGDAHLSADEIDVFQVALRPLDALLLCSDGLWEMVRDAEIEQIMLDAPDPVAAAQTLIDVANHNGGEDNISVIIAQTLTSLDD